MTDIHELAIVVQISDGFLFLRAVNLSSKAYAIELNHTFTKELMKRRIKRKRSTTLNHSAQVVVGIQRFVHFIHLQNLNSRQASKQACKWKVEIKVDFRFLEENDKGIYVLEDDGREDTFFISN